MADFFDRVLPEVEKTIDLLRKKKFRVDPIAGQEYSRSTSVISSAYKRHGKIIEAALRERLKDNDEFVVWDEPLFKVSQPANILSGNANDCKGASLAYGDDVRTVQIDLIVYDKNNHTLRAYEVKRGNGSFDAGKKRSIMRDLLSTQVLLKSYGEQRGYEVGLAEAKIIFYYGLRSIPEPYSLIGDELDAHFGFDLVAAIELVNEYFKERLFEILQN